MTVQETTVALRRDIWSNYTVLESNCPFENIDREFVKARLGDKQLVEAIRAIWESGNKLQGILSKATSDSVHIVPGIDEDLYRFYHDVVRPRRAKLLGLWSATLDVDLFDLFGDVVNSDTPTEHIKNIFMSGIDFWDMQVSDGRSDEADEFVLNDAMQVIGAPYFDPDGWLDRSGELRPILLKDWNYRVPRALSKRLSELYLYYMFGNWLAATSLSRSVLEFVLLEALIELGVAVTDEADPKRVISLERLITLAESKKPVFADELHYIRKWGNAVMHPEQGDRVSEYPARKKIAKSCIERLVRAVEALYR